MIDDIIAAFLQTSAKVCDVLIPFWQCVALPFCQRTGCIVVKPCRISSRKAPAGYILLAAVTPHYRRHSSSAAVSR